MNKWQIICPLVAIFTVALAGGFIHVRGEHNRFLMTATRSIGQDLIASTNSLHLAGLDPRLHAQLSALLRSKADVASVIVGDERAPNGPGKACSQLVLTNNLGEGLAIRLGPDTNSWFFTVLSHRTITGPGGPANRDKPVGSETNRTSGAAVPTVEQFKMRATVQDVTLIQRFTGTVVQTHSDPRYVLTLRIESITPLLSNFTNGSIARFAIHSPSLLFAGETPKGKTLDFVLTLEAQGATPRFFGLAVERKGDRAIQPTRDRRLSSSARKNHEPVSANLPLGGVPGHRLR